MNNAKKNKKWGIMRLLSTNRTWGAVTLCMFTCILLLTIGASSVCAQSVPKRIRYIAVLANPAGEPVDGTFTVTFTIFDAESGGTEVFVEEHTGVVINKRDSGSFSLEIGSIETLDLDFNVQYWIAVAVVNDTGHSSGYFMPTKRVLGSGYSLTGDMVDGVEGAGILRSDVGDELTANLTITENLYIGASISGSSNIIVSGTPEDVLTIDKDNTGDIVTLEYGSINQERLYYNILEDEFHLSDGLSIGGGLTVNGVSNFAGGIGVNVTGFTLSPAGDIHTDGTLNVVGITTLNGDIVLGDDAADNVSIIGVIDSAITFNSTQTLRTNAGDLLLYPDLDIQSGISADTVISRDLTIYGDKIFGSSTLAMTFADGQMTIENDLTAGGNYIISPNDFTLNPEQGSAGVLRLGVLAEEDAVYLAGTAITLAGNLSVGGKLAILDLVGTSRDSFRIDSDDSTTTPTLIFRDSDGDESFLWNDTLSTFEISDDLSFNGPLTVEGEIATTGTGYSRFANSRIEIGSGNMSTLVMQPGDLFVSGDAEVAGDVSVGGDLSLPGFIASGDGQGVTVNEDLTLKRTLFVDDIANDDQVALTIGNDANTIVLNSIDWDITTVGDLYGIGDITSDGTLFLTNASGSPSLSVSGSTQLGDGDTDAHAIRGTTTFGTGNTVTVANNGNLSVSDSVQFGADASDDFSLTSSGLIVRANNDVLDQDSALLINDDVSITGDLTVDEDLYVYGSGIHRFRNDSLIIGDDSTASGLVTGSGGLFVALDGEIGGNLSIARDLTVYGRLGSGDGSFSAAGDLTITDTLFVDRIDDEINEGILFAADVTTQQNLTLGGNIMYSTDNFIINPQEGAAAVLTLGGPGENDWVAIEESLSVSGDLTVGGIIYGVGDFTDTIADSFGIDLDDTTDTPTLIFADGGGDKTLIWNDLSGEFELNNNLSMAGNLTVEQRLLVQGNGRSLFSGTNHAIEITDGHILIYDALSSVEPTTTFNEDGDLFVEDDFELGGDLSVGGDMTIIGVIFSDDYTRIIGNLTIDGDLDVRGRIYDGLAPELDILDDLSVSGDLSVWGGDIYIGGAAGDGRFRFRNNTEQFGWSNAETRVEATDDLYGPGTFVFGGTTMSTPVYNVIASSNTISPSGLISQSNDLFVEGDLEIAGDISMGGDVTILGVVFSDDYTMVIGPLTVMGDLDVRGRVLDGIGVDVDIVDNVLVSDDVTVEGSDVFLLGDRILFSGGDEQVYFDNVGSEFIITDGIGVDGVSTTSGGALFGDDAADIFTVTTSGVSVTQDGRIYDPGSAVEIQDDLTLSGNLSVAGGSFLGDTVSDSFALVSAGINISVDGTIDDRDSALRIYDDLSIGGELSVDDEITIHGTGLSRFSNGRVYVASDTPSALAQQGGDIYIQNDVEVMQDLSAGGDATIGGNLSVAGEIKPTNIYGTSFDTFIIDMDDTTDTPTLAFEDADGPEYLTWNDGINTTAPDDGIDSFVLSDDLSVGGEFTADGELIVERNEVTRFRNGRVFIGDGMPSTMVQQDGDMYVLRDVEIGDDLSLGGDVSIAGVIFSDDYTKIMGSLTVGDDIDVRGRIFDGASEIVDVLDDLSVSGDVTVWGSDVYLGSNDGVDDIIRFSGDQESIRWNATLPSFEFTSDLSIAHNLTVEDGTIDLDTEAVITDDVSGFTQIAPKNNQLALRDGTDNQFFLVYDSTGNRYVSLDMSQDPHARLLISAGDLLIQTNNDQDQYIYFTMAGNEPYIGTQGAALLGIDTDGNEVHLVDGESLYVDVDTLYADATNDRVTIGTTVGTNTLEVIGNAYISADATVSGSDISLGAGDGTLFVDSGNERIQWNSAQDEFEMTNDLSISGRMTIPGVLRVGHDQGNAAFNVIDSDSIIQSTPGLLDSANDLFIEGDVEVGGDLSLGGDVSIAGVIFSDDFTYIVDPLTIGGDLDIRGRLYDGAGIAIDILDDLSIAGELSVWGSDIYLGVSGGDDDIIRLSGNTQQFGWTESNAYFEMADDVSLSGALTISDGNLYLDTTSQISDDNSNYTQVSPQNNHLVVRDGTDNQFFIVYDLTGNQYVSLDMSQGADARLLVSNGDLLLQTNDDQDQYIYFTMADNEPYLATQGGADFSIDTDSNQVFIQEGESLFVDTDTLVVDGTNNNVIVGATSGTYKFEVIGNARTSDDLTISGADVYFGVGSSTLHFANNQEQLIWHDVQDEFRFTDDVSISGDLSVLGSTSLGDTTNDSFALASNGVSVDVDGTITDIASVVHIYDDLSVTGELSIADVITVQGTDLSRFSQGRVYIGSTDPSTIAQQSGDLYIEEDIEIGGDLSVGGDITIIGVIFSDDFTQVIGPLSASDDLDVRGRIYDGAGVEIDILDDLSVSNDLTVWGQDIYVGGENADGSIRFRNDNEEMRWDEAGHEFEITNDVYLSGLLTTGAGAVIGDIATDIFAVTSSGLNIVQDGGIFDYDSVVQVNDSLSISEKTTVSGTLRVGNASGAVIYNAIDDDAVVNGSPALMDAPNDLFVEDDLELIGDLSMGGDFSLAGIIFTEDLTEVIGSLTITDDLDFRGRMFDGTAGAVDLDDDLSIAGDLSVWEAHLYVMREGSDDPEIFSNPNILIDPNAGGPGVLTFGGAFEDDMIYLNADVTINGFMSISDDLTVYGNLYGTLYIFGTTADSFTIDQDDTTDTPSLMFEDSDGDEYFRWNDGENTLAADDGVDSFELSDDFIIDGDLTLEKALLVLDVETGGTSRFSGAGHTVEISDGRLEILDSGASFVSTTGFADDGDLLVQHDFELGGNLSIGGDVTILGVIFSDDYTEIIGSLTVGDDLDVRGRIFDGAEATVDMYDDVSVSGMLSVWGADIFFSGNGTKTIQFRAANEQIAWVEGDDQFYSDNDFYVNGSLTATGGAVIGDDANDIFEVTGSGLNILQHGEFYDRDTEVEVRDSLSVSGDLTVSHTMRIGHSEGAYPFNVIDDTTAVQATTALMNARNDLYIAGDMEVGADLTLGGDISITGVIFADDYTGIIGSLTVDEDLDVRGHIFDGINVEVDVLDDLSVSGELSVWGSDIYLGVAGGDDDLIRMSGDTKEVGWRESTSYLEMPDDLSFAGNMTVEGGNLYLGTSSQISNDNSAYSQLSPQNNHLALRDGTDNQFFLVYDSTGNQYVSLDMSQGVDGRLLVSNGDLLLQTNDDQDQYMYFTMAGNEPYLGTQGGADFSIDTDGNEVHIVDGETVYVDTNTLYVDAADDRVGIGTLAETHTLEVIGTVRMSDDVTVSGTDIYVGGTTGTLHYGNNAEQFVWNNGQREFQMTNDLSISGRLTVPDIIRVGYDQGIVAYSAIDMDGVVEGTPGLMDAANDLYIEGDFEIGQDVSLGGDVSIAGVIFADDYTYIVDPLTIGGDLDIRGRIFDGINIEVDILDDLSVSGELSVWGSDIYLGVNDNTDDLIRMHGGAKVLAWRESENEFRLADDVSVAGYLTVPGVLRVGHPEGAVGYTAFDDDANVQGTPGLISNYNDVYIEGDFEVGRDLSLGGDVSIRGVIFSDDHTEIIGSLTSGNDMDVRGRLFDGVGIEIDVLDDLSVSGDVTVWGADIYLGSDDAVNDRLRFSGDTEYVMWDATNDLFEISDDLSIGDAITISGRNLYFDSEIRMSDDTNVETQIAPQNDHLVVRDGTDHQFFLVYDSTGNQYVSLDMSQGADARLLVSNGDLLLQTNDDQDQYIYFTMAGNEPYLGTQGGADFSIDTDGNEVYLVDGESLYVDTNTLYADGVNDRVVVGATSGTHKFEVIGDGRISTDLTVSGTDVHMGTTTGIVHFDDNSERFAWYNAANEFALTDDLSVSGDLSVWGNTRLGDTTGDTLILVSSGLNIALNGTIVDTDSMVRVDDDMSITGELTVNDDITIYGDDYSRFVGGEVYIADSHISSFITDTGSLYVQNDAEIMRDLSVGNNVTISGDLCIGGSLLAVIEGTISEKFTIDANDNSDTPTLGFEDSDGEEYFRWNDLISTLELSEDLSIHGELTVIKELIVERNASSRLRNGRLYIGDDDPSSIAQQQGDLYVKNDIELGGDLSIGGDMTIIGVIFSDDHTEVIGDLIVGENLDVRGDIFDGAAVHVDVSDNVSVSDDLTIWGSDVHMAQSGLLNQEIYFDGQNELLYFDEPDSGAEMISHRNDGTAYTRFALSDDLSINKNVTISSGNLYLDASSQISNDDSYYSQIAPQNDHLVVRDGTDHQFFLVYDSTGNQYVSLDMSQGADARLLVSNGDLLLQTNDDQDQYLYFTMAGNEPYLGTQGSAGFRIDTAGNEVRLADGENLYVDTDTLYADAVNDRVLVGGTSSTHTHEVFGDGRMSGDLTMSGADFIMNAADDYIHMGTRDDQFMWEAARDEFGFSNDVSVSGQLTVSNVLRIGNDQQAVAYNAIDMTGAVEGTPNLMNARNDLYVEGDFEVGSDLSLGGDVSIAGVIFSDDYTEIIGDLTVGDDLDVRGRMYDGAGLAIDILDDLSISGDTTIDGTLFVAENTVASDSDGLIDLGRNSSAWEFIMWDDSEDRFRLSKDLIIDNDTGISRLYFDDGTSESQLRYDSEEYGFHLTNNVSISDNLTVWSGYVSSSADMTVNSIINGKGVIQLGVASENDDVIIAGQATVQGTTWVGGNILVGGILFGEMPTDGTNHDVFVIDTDDSTDTPTLAFHGVDPKMFWWNDGVNTLVADDGIDSFEMNRDLIIEGDLTVGGGLSVNGGNDTSYFSGASHTLEFYGSNLEIYDGGPFKASSNFVTDGDLVVGRDIEIGDNLSIGGDVTIAGVVFSYNNTEIIGSLTVGDDIDVRGLIYDGVGPDVDVLDDLSIAGTINVDTMGENDIEGYLNLGTATSANNQGDTAMSGEMTVANNLITYGSGTYISDKDTDYTGLEIQNNHLVVRDGTDNQSFLVYDSTGNQYVSLDMSQGADARLLVSNGDLLLQTNDDQDQYIYFTMAGNEPYLRTQGGTNFSFDTDGDAVAISDGDSLYVDTNTLYVDGVNDRVGIGTVVPTHTLEVIGAARVSDDLTVSGGDIYFNNTNGMIQFDDNSKQLWWVDARDEFYVPDDVSLTGNMTVSELLRVGHDQGAVGYNAIDDDSNVQGSPSLMNSQSDLYIEGDEEVGQSISIIGSLSLGGNLSVTGKIVAEANVPGTTSETFTIDTTDTTDTPTLAFRDPDGDEIYRWNDLIKTFEMSDDLSVGGHVTVEQNLLVLRNDTSRIRNGRVYIGSTDPSTISQQDGDLYVEGDIEMGGNLSVGGDTTIIGVIFSDDFTEVIGDLIVNEDLNVPTELYDGAGIAIDVLDDLSVSSDVTVWGSDIFIGYAGGDNDRLRFQGGSEQLYWNESNNEFIMTDDVDVPVRLTVSDVLRIGFDQGAVSYSAIDMDGNVQGSSSIMNNRNDLYVEGDVEIVGDLSIGGNTTIAGVVFSDDYTYVVGDLTAGDDLDVRGRIYDGAGVEIDILDDLSVSGDLTVWGADVYLAEPGYYDKEIRFSGDTEAITFVSYKNAGEALQYVASNYDDNVYFEVSDDLSMANNLTITERNIFLGDELRYTDDDSSDYSQLQPQNNHLVVRDGSDNQFFLVYDSTGNQYVSLDMSQGADARLLVSDGDLLLQTNDDQDNYLYFTMAGNEPYIQTSGSAQLGINTDGNEVHIVDGETLYVDTDTLFVDGTNDRVVVGQTSGTHKIEVIGDARFSDDFTVSGGDLYMGTTDGTIRFDDDSEQLVWYVADGEFAVTDDLSVAGDLSVWGSTRLGDTTNDSFALVASGLNVAVDGSISDADSAVRIDEDVTITGELSVNDNMTIRGSGLSRWENGRVYIAGDTPSAFVQQSGDLYVENDMEMGGMLTVGRDMTIFGNLSVAGEVIVDIDGVDSPIFTIDENDNTDRPSLAFEDINGDETLRWNDFINTFEMSDDLSVAGEITIEGELDVEGNVISRFENGRVYIGDDNPSGIATDAGDLYVKNDIEVGGDLSIGGDVTIAGVIFSDDHTQIMGSLTTGTDLDVRGRIFDGAALEVDIFDNLSVSDDLTVWGSDLALPADGFVNQEIYFDGQNEILYFDTVNDFGEYAVYNVDSSYSAFVRFSLSDDLSTSETMTVTGGNLYLTDTSQISNDNSDYSQIVSQNNHLYLRDGTDNQFFLVYDSTGNQYVSLDMSQNPDARLLVSDGDLLIQTNDDQDQYMYFTMAGNEPYLGTQGSSAFGIDTDGDEVHIMDGDSLYVDANTLFVDAVDDRVGIGTLAETHTLETIGTGYVSDDLTVSGSDIDMGSFIGTFHFGSPDDQILWNDVDLEFGVKGDLSITGSLTVPGVLRIGNDQGNVVYNAIDMTSPVQGSSGLMNAANDLYVEGDVEVGGDISMAGDVTIAGVIFSDDHTQIMGSLTTGTDLDVRGRIFDGVGIDIDILDNISVSGHTTIDGVLFVANNTTANDSDGSLYLGRNNNAWETVRWDDTLSRFRISDSLELAQSGDVKIILNDGTSTGEILFDNELYGFHMNSNLSVSDNLTVMGGYISTDSHSTINPDIGNAALLTLGIAGESDQIRLNGTTTVDGYLTTSDDVVVDGIIYAAASGGADQAGTLSDTWTIDLDDTTDTPTLVFTDSNGNEYIRWNDEVDLVAAGDGIDSFEISEDLSIGGDLTVRKRLRVEAAGGRSYFSGTSHTLEISDGNLEIYDSATSFTPTSGFVDDGDLAVQHDIDIGGDLSIGGDVSIAGVIFADDHN